MNGVQLGIYPYLRVLQFERVTPLNRPHLPGGTVVVDTTEDNICALFDLGDTELQEKLSLLYSQTTN